MTDQTALTVQQPQVVTHTNGKVEALDHFVRRVLFPGVSEDTLMLTQFMCQRYQLDPILKHVVVIKFGGKDAPYITRDGLLFIAHRTNLLDGMEVNFGSDQDGLYAECTVWRKDCQHPFRFRAYRADYDNKRNVWQTNPRAMTQKTAECMALKRAFNIDMTALEEMDGAIERDGGEVVQGVAFVTDEDHVITPAAELEKKLNGNPQGEPPPAPNGKHAEPPTPEAPALPSERKALIDAISKAHKLTPEVVTASLKKYEAVGGILATDSDDTIKEFVAKKIAAASKPAAPKNGGGPVTHLQSRTEPILALDALRADVLACVEANAGWDTLPVEKRQLTQIAMLISEMMPHAGKGEQDDIRHNLIRYFFGKSGASELDKAQAAAFIYWLTNSDGHTANKLAVEEMAEILGLMEELAENADDAARAEMEQGE